MMYIKKFEHKKTYTSEDIFLAIRKNDIDYIEDAHNNDYNFDIIPNNSTYLSYAIFHGKYEVVKKLIDFGVNINLQTTAGNTPLIKSSEYDEWKIMRLLIDSGADWNIKNNIGLQFLDLLEEYQRNEIIKEYPEEAKEYLISKTADKYNL